MTSCKTCSGFNHADTTCCERNIGLRIAFDGGGYHGWQRQPNTRTVEGTLCAAINMFEKREVKFVSASRTDAGVHATGQYANFFSRYSTIPADKYATILNRYLPSSVTVLESCERPLSFHSRYSAKKRTYVYSILPFLRTSSCMPPDCYTKYYTIRTHVPALAKCNRALSTILGTHDFRNFAKIDRNNTSRSTVRTVYEAVMYPYGQAIRLKITANSFLRTMVRSIVGTVCDKALCAPAHMRKLLHAGNRAFCGMPAPAHGLCLDWISYE